MELDPKTVKYNVNYDERRHFKNIEFTEGSFIGVSVLGKDQQPAFTGSEFFSCDEFTKKMEILRKYCEEHNSQNNQGDEEMNFQEFMKLSWGDISSKVDEALMNEYGNEAFTMIHDMFEDSAIVRWYSYIDGTAKLMRVKYTVDENGNVTLGDVNEVHVTYEDVVSTNASKGETGAQQPTEGTEGNASVNTAEVSNAEETPAAATNDVSTNPEASVDEVTPVTGTDLSVQNGTNPEDVTVTDVNPNEGVATCSSASSSAEVTTPKKVSVDDEQPKEENSSSTSFTESERAEFERNFKREEKIKLIDSFKEFLSEEEYNNFVSTIDNVEMEELTSGLVKASKQDKTLRAFSLAQPKMKEENTLDSWVRKNL